jgi:hypothetical protein
VKIKKHERLQIESGLGWCVYGRYVVSITKCKVSVLGVDSHFFIIKIKPPAQTCKMAAKRYNSSDTISRVIYGVYNSSTLHNDHDKENIILKIKIKKHWKLKYEKYTGFKAEMEKNRDKRPIPKQKPCIDRQKSSFFLVVWPRNGSLSPPKMLGTPK